MNKKVIKRIGIGVFLYAIFAIAVIKLYPDTPLSMDWEDRQEYNQIQISQVELGVSKDEILQLLGSPDITEAKKISNTELQVMFYRTGHVQADGITTQDECTPLLFKNSKLIAFGKNAYQAYIDG
ncbi:DUF3192 domain-containing protein [Paraglaciecola sp.]|uniref:DUF3192 domain-containing protein n=1 Tax=Paraglaciecola sp. TaxID=1920173 RepID=UPI003EF9533E